MLNDKLFEQEWKILCKVFHRKPDPTIYERFYIALSEELKNQQFQDICKEILKTKTRFPTIADLLALKPPSPPPSYELPAGAIDIRVPNQHDPVAWAKATLALPNHPRWGNFKRRAQEILGATHEPA
jgi:hypothetical protein